MNELEIERRLEKLEKKIEHIDAAFVVFRDVLIKIQNENVQLRKNRDFLLEKHKEIMKKSIDKEKLAGEIKEKLINPVHKELQEDIQLIKNLTSKNVSENDSSHLDELFVLVMNNESITLKNAAKHFDVHELQIEEWARTLEDHGLIDIVKKDDITELRKSVYK